MKESIIKINILFKKKQNFNNAFVIAEIPFIRTKKISSKNSPDYEWVNQAFEFYKKKKINFSHYFILRPTSPFRIQNQLNRLGKNF